MLKLQIGELLLKNLTLPKKPEFVEIQGLVVEDSLQQEIQECPPEY